MKKTKTNDPKYPLKVTLSDGTVLTVPRQSKFSDNWLRKHGCSLVAEFIAFEFLGYPKRWPLYLREWHKEHTPSEIFAKVTVRGVAEALKERGAKKGTATYSKTVTAKRIRTALDGGALVIVERGNPIHTLTFVKDGDTVYKLNAGTCSKSSAEWAAKVATKSKRYRGMVIVRRKP